MEPHITSTAGSWVGAALQAAIRVYQVTFSWLFAGSCRFLPSCSDYAREAIRLHGPVRGTRLAAGRICRCHPFASAGHDPVPRPPTASGS